MKKKHVKFMWLIHDTLFVDKERAKRFEDGKDKVKLVYVGVDNDDFIETSCPANYYDGWIFDDENEAKREVEIYNQD